MTLGGCESLSGLGSRDFWGELSMGMYVNVFSLAALLASVQRVRNLLMERILHS